MNQTLKGLCKPSSFLAMYTLGERHNLPGWREGTCPARHPIAKHARRIISRESRKAGVCAGLSVSFLFGWWQNGPIRVRCSLLRPHWSMARWVFSRAPSFDPEPRGAAADFGCCPGGAGGWGVGGGLSGWAKRPVCPEWRTSCATDICSAEDPSASFLRFVGAFHDRRVLSWPFASGGPRARTICLVQVPTCERPASETNTSKWSL